MKTRLLSAALLSVAFGMPFVTVAFAQPPTQAEEEDVAEESNEGEETEVVEEDAEATEAEPATAAVDSATASEASDPDNSTAGGIRVNPVASGGTPG